MLTLHSIVAIFFCLKSFIVLVRRAYLAYVNNICFHAPYQTPRAEPPAGLIQDRDVIDDEIDNILPYNLSSGTRELVVNSLSPALQLL
jgi:hypothetical protein